MKRWFVVFWGVLLLPFFSVSLVSQSASPSERVIDAQMSPVVFLQPETPTRLILRRGVSAVLIAKGLLRRFVLGDPQIVALNILTERELVVNAKSEGTTNLLVWEERAGQTFVSTLWLEVVPIKKEEPAPPPKPPDPAQLQALLSQALKGLPIEPLVFVLPDGTVAAVLRGEVATPEEAKAAEALASLVATKVINLLKVRAVPQITLSPEELKALRIETAVGIPGVRVALVDDKVVLYGTVNSLMERQTAEERAKPFGTIVNRIEVAQPKIRQFVTEVKVLEVSRTALQRLGITFGSVIGAVGVQPGQPQVGIFSVQSGQVIFGEPGTVDRPIARATPVGAQLDALLQNGLARLLANPQQRTIEGADATFLVGGLVPIPVFGFFGVGAGAAAPGAATVVFFPFGITLTLHPEATLQGEIFLQMRVEVTSPDFGLAVQVLGTTVPGFRFRGLDDVRLLLKDGDTIVISGLIQDELREQVNRVPLLSRIPILGELFKSREFVRQQTELVLLVTVRMEEVPVSPEALQLLQTYQKRPVLPRPSFVVPLGGVGGGLGGGLGGIGGGLGGVGGIGGALSGMPTPSP